MARTAATRRLWRAHASPGAQVRKCHDGAWNTLAKKVPVGCKTETSVNSWPAQTPRAHFSCDVVGGFGFAALPVLYNHVARAFNPSSSRRGQWPRAKHRLREPRPFYRYTVQYCFVRVRLPCVLRTFGRFPRVHHFRQKVQGKSSSFPRACGCSPEPPRACAVSRTKH